MLRISKLTDYAVVILGQMARETASVHTAAELADKTGVAVPTVSKILKCLAKTHIVTSTRGSRGGYSLARAAEQTSVAAVIYAMEGPIALTECEGERGGCEQSSSCHARSSWDVINRAIRTALDSVTLSDMVKPMTGGMPSQEVSIPVAVLHKPMKSN